MAFLTWAATERFEGVDILVAIHVLAVHTLDLLRPRDDALQTNFIDLHKSLFFHVVVQLPQQSL
jgi:hypothetical protein